MAQEYIAPLRELIPLRITAGLYYDLVAGPAALRNDASGRFEEYGRRFVAAMLPEVVVDGAHEYMFRGQRVHSPDMLLREARGGTVAALIECKATKLTFVAQFSNDPLEEAKSAFRELAKGVFQIWRYASHVRQGIVVGRRLDDQWMGVVLTLDNWFVLGTPQRNAVVEMAGQLADKDGGILPQDRRPVLFCSMPDLEQSLASVDYEGFKLALGAMSEPRFSGWILPNVCRELKIVQDKQKKYPFEPGAILPWWEAVANIRGAMVDRQDRRLPQ